MWSSSVSKGRGRGASTGKSTAKTAISRVMSGINVKNIKKLDLSAVDDIDFGRVELPNKDNPLSLIIYITPKFGLWDKATYNFNVNI